MPLATFRVVGTGIGQLDMWGVRRRLHPPAPRDVDGTVTGIELRAGDLRAATGEATLWQFQAHLNDELAAAGGEPGSVRASRSFRWLPAAGLLPSEMLGATDAVAAFAAQGAVPFFEDVPHQALGSAVPLDRVEEILRRGFEMPAALPEADWGAPLSVALVRGVENDLTHGIFFAAGHPFEDRMTIADLTRRVEVLEAGSKPEAPDGGVVRVDYDPSRPSAEFLGPKPTLGHQESGLLRFRVLITQAGAYRLSVSIDEEGRPAGLHRLDAILLGKDRRPVRGPDDRPLGEGANSVDLLVRAIGGFFARGSVTLILAVEATEGSASGQGAVAVRLGLS